MTIINIYVSPFQVKVTNSAGNGIAEPISSKMSAHIMGRIANDYPEAHRVLVRQYFRAQSWKIRTKSEAPDLRAILAWLKEE